MNIQEFIDNFAAQFDETDPDEIKADTKFKDLDEWSSLTALSIIAMVDDEYDVIIKGNDILKSDTIQDLFAIVEKNPLMESRVKEIISRVLNVDLDRISDDLSSGDIPEWDSVGNLAIISTLEQELGVEFPLEDLFDLTSVKSIIDEINKLLHV